MRRLQIAFALVAAVVSLFPLAAGCQNNVTVAGHDPRCPADFPDGRGCTDDGLTCTYQALGCDIVYECTGDQWSSPSSDCTTPCAGGNPDSACLIAGEICSFGDQCYYEEWNCTDTHTWDVFYGDSGDECCYGECGCDPSYCAPSPPEPGSSCDPCFDSVFCSWELITPCGMQVVDAECTGDFTWQVSDVAPCDCSFHQTVEECEADTTCRYLTGGCEAPSLDQPGCFPKTDCSADVLCPDGKTCTAVNANVCSIDPCIECSAATLCL
jgi:hypothetical protein